MARQQLQPLFAMLSVAHHQLEARWRQALGISAYEITALIHLQQGPLIIGDLGQRLALTSGAMTGLVDRLVKADLVQRLPDLDDGRKVLLHLTPQAQTHLARLQRPLGEAIEGIERELAPAETSRLADLLDSVIDAMTASEGRTK